MRHFPMFIICMLIVEILGAQTYYSPQSLQNQNRIYSDHIQTVILHPEGDPLGMPILPLEGSQALQLQFDDLEGSYKVYKYTVIHCDASWNISLLRPNEYIDGFDYDEIRDYAYSFNTTIPYTNYQLLFPNDRMRLTQSGNYLLVVYLEEVDKPVFTHRFMVYENKVRIEQFSQGRASLPSFMQSSQEVDFRIRPGKYSIPAPARDLKVMIMQNGRWDNTIMLKQPRNITQEYLDYDFEEENLFEAGNQYRPLDIKSVRYRSERIADIAYLSDGYHIYLKPDEVRAGKPFRSEPDINGKRLIKTEDMQRSEVEADYTHVHFSFPFPYPLAQGSIYIIGELTGNELQPFARMTYNYNTSQYEAVLLLKQGYYNYMYIMVPEGKSKGETASTEGNHWEAPNEYILLVYHREPGDAFDKIIGYFLSQQ